MSFLRQNGVFFINQGSFLGCSTIYLANKLLLFISLGKDSYQGLFASSKIIFTSLGKDI